MPFKELEGVFICFGNAENHVQKLNGSVDFMHSLHEMCKTTA
jgi:hypothetical protein